MAEATGGKQSCRDHVNGMQRDEQGEEASAGHAVRGKCMLAVAKGRERVRAQWREEREARY